MDQHAPQTAIYWQVVLQIIKFATKLYNSDVQKCEQPSENWPRKIEDVQTFPSLWQSRLALTLLPSNTLMLRQGTVPRTPLHRVNGIGGPISDPF